MIAKSSILHGISAVVIFHFRKYVNTWYITDIVMNLKPAARTREFLTELNVTWGRNSLGCSGKNPCLTALRGYTKFYCAVITNLCSDKNKMCSDYNADKISTQKQVLREVKFPIKIMCIRKISGNSLVNESLMDLLMRSSTLIFVCSKS